LVPSLSASALQAMLFDRIQGEREADLGMREAIQGD